MSVWLERTDGRADARDEDARLIVDATCRRVNLMLIMAGTNHLAMEGAPCMVLHSIQTLPRGVSNGRRPHSGVACAPELFPLSRIGASVASVMY